MNTNKNISEGKLSELFREIPFDNPSSGFMDDLFVRIKKEVAHEKKKRRFITAGQIAAGISGIFILPALTIYLCMIFLPDYSFALPQMHFNLKFDSNLIVIGCSILILLIIDTLFRTHSRKNDLQ